MKVQSLFIYQTILAFVSGTHFRGGTLSWKLKPIGGFDVEFKFKMAWSYGNGPGCTKQKIGQFVNDDFIGRKQWTCDSGCDIVGNSTTVGTVYYICTAVDITENSEQGENTFIVNFNRTGPFILSYSGAQWMTLSAQPSNDDRGWNLFTQVVLDTRNDTNKPNSSPVTASKPLYSLQFECKHEIMIPMVDPDGDDVRCRWAVDEECHSICHGVPGAMLDEESCTLAFVADNSTFKEDGWYAVALTVEDFPQNTITIGNDTCNTTTPLTSIPLQFLIHVIRKPLECLQKPIFVSPTPSNGSKITVPAHTTTTTKIYASNERNLNASIASITLIRPPGLEYKGPYPDPGRPGVVYWDLTWKPSHSQQGNNILCAMVTDNMGQKSDSYCFTYIAWDNDPCLNALCQHKSTCNRMGSTQSYNCLCSDGYSGTYCEIDVDACLSHPCLNGATCLDGVDNFTCSCASGFYGITCETKIKQSSISTGVKTLFSSSNVLIVLVTQFIVVLCLLTPLLVLSYKIRQMRNRISGRQELNDTAKV